MINYIVKRESYSGLFNFNSLDDAQKLCRGLKDKFNISDLILWKIENDQLERMEISNEEKYQVSEKELLQLLGIFIK